MDQPREPPRRASAEEAAEEREPGEARGRLEMMCLAVAKRDGEDRRDLVRADAEGMIHRHPLLERGCAGQGPLLAWERDDVIDDGGQGKLRPGPMGTRPFVARCR